MGRVAVDWWDGLVDRWVRVKSDRLDDATLMRRKLLHTTQVLAFWPLLRLEPSWLVLILAVACAFVLLTQRRLPYTSLALLTLLAFAGRLAIAGAWVVFTMGDGLAALVGRRAGGPTLPWNDKKTCAGSLAFLVAGSLTLFLLLSWQGQGLGWKWSLLLALGATSAGGCVESLDIVLDDNYSVLVVVGSLLELALLFARAR